MTVSSYHHLLLEERKEIEVCLNLPGITLKQIAAKIERSQKCVREEIKSHRKVRIRANQKNKCGKQNSCEIRRLCTHCITGLCKGCTHDNCNQLCTEFSPNPVCPGTDRFPYVCSACDQLEKCKMPKYFYIADIAHSEYERDKTVWREGPRKSEAEMKAITEALQGGVKLKQSVDVIIHTEKLPVSTSTAYRYIAKRQIPNVMNVDLKRQVRYKSRNKSKPKPVPLDYDWLEGRRFEDFLNLIEELEPTVNIWEMDTIIGKRDEEKCVLSLLHRRSNLQLYFLLKAKNMLEVSKIFGTIREVLGNELFKEIFTIILTDNGSEFHDPISIETDSCTGEKLISVFYARPRRSDDKGKCEKNHEHFRECVPKGLSMEPLSKKDINHVSLMVNNYPRAKLNYNSPYEIADKLLNKKVFELNQLRFVPTKLVDLTPILH